MPAPTVKFSLGTSASLPKEACNTMIGLCSSNAHLVCPPSSSYVVCQEGTMVPKTGKRSLGNAPLHATAREHEASPALPTPLDAAPRGLYQRGLTHPDDGFIAMLDIDLEKNTAEVCGRPLEA